MLGAMVNRPMCGLLISATLALPHPCICHCRHHHLCALQPHLSVQPATSAPIHVTLHTHLPLAGTIISATRNMSDVMVTSIVLKNNVTLVDIVSTRMMVSATNTQCVGSCSVVCEGKHLARALESTDKQC